MRIGIAQINPCVGDIENNAALIISYIHKALAQGVDLILFPELALTGYPPEDLLFRPALYTKIDRALKSILNESAGIQLVLGYPRRDGGKLYNSCAFIRDGVITATYDKMELPNYGVFDEKRYFTAGTTACVVDLNGITAALTICEDIWSPRPAKLALEAGARLIININASPFHMHKALERDNILHTRHSETRLPVIYANMIGGQDELVFDGGSMLMNSEGEITYRAPFFKEDLYVINVNADGKGKLRFDSPAPVDETDPDETIYLALVQGVRDYVYKNHFNGVVIGLSGGVDSALVTCLAVDALGKDNVEVLLMPSRYTAEMSIEDSLELADNLGISRHIISIEEPFNAFVTALDPLFRQLPADTTEENIQARCRGILLMAVSNKSRKLVLTTGNKSEMSVGYATLYGDMAGGYAPLKDVAKLLVYRLSRWRNSQSCVIPERIIERPPSAELRPDQKDEDSLPPYHVLDPILERYIEQDQTPQQIINAGYDYDSVTRITKLVDLSEYKRRQSAPGVKITRRAFGRERRYPISSGYREE